MYRRIRTKGCRRCGGDLAWEHDKYGSYIACIQCGAEDKELSERLLTRYGTTLTESTRRGKTRVGGGIADGDIWKAKTVSLSGSAK